MKSAPAWESLLALDQESVWHPYGALPAALPSLPVVSAQGVRLTLADGRELIDGMASWWCAIHGYRHPTLDGAVTEQLGTKTIEDGPRGRAMPEASDTSANVPSPWLR